MIRQITLLFILLLILTFSNQSFSSATSNASEEVRGQIKFGIRAAQNDHWDEAIYRWQKAILLDSNNVMAHNDLAVAYEQLGEYSLAMEEYQTAYRLDSQNAAVKNNLDRFKDFYRKYQHQNQK